MCSWFLVDLICQFQFDDFFMAKWVCLRSCPKNILKNVKEADLAISSIKSVAKKMLNSGKLVSDSGSSQRSFNKEANAGHKHSRLPALFSAFQAKRKNITTNIDITNMIYFLRFGNNSLIVSGGAVNVGGTSENERGDIYIYVVYSFIFNQ